MWLCFFFFKQKTAYELRISDWSSDVCSSDLGDRAENDRDHDCRHECAHQYATASDREGRRNGCLEPPCFTLFLSECLNDLHCAQYLGHSCAHIGDSVLTGAGQGAETAARSEEHTSETPVTNAHLVCRLLLEKKNTETYTTDIS